MSDKEGATEPAGKGRGGAPTGNVNALKHGFFSPRLSALKRIAGSIRDRHRRAAEREAREILVSAGLAGDPLARIVARNLARLEGMISRLESHHQSRGYFNRIGEIKGSVTQEISVIARLLDEARKLFEGLREFRAGQVPAGTVYQATLSSGQVIASVHTEPAAALDITERTGSDTARDLPVDSAEIPASPAAPESTPRPSRASVLGWIERDVKL